MIGKRRQLSTIEWVCASGIVMILASLLVPPPMSRRTSKQSCDHCGNCRLVVKETAGGFGMRTGSNRSGSTRSRSATNTIGGNTVPRLPRQPGRRGLPTSTYAIATAQMTGRVSRSSEAIQSCQKFVTRPATNSASNGSDAGSIPAALSNRAAVVISTIISPRLSVSLIETIGRLSAF